MKNKGVNDYVSTVFIKQYLKLNTLLDLQEI